MLRYLFPLALMFLGQPGYATIVVPRLVNSGNITRSSVVSPLETDTALGASVENLTNGSGLLSPILDGDSLEYARTVEHARGSQGQIWGSWVTVSRSPYYLADLESGESYPFQAFLWDLGATYLVDHILLWQYGNDGGTAFRDGNGLSNFLIAAYDVDTPPELEFRPPNSRSFNVNRLWPGTGNPAQVFALDGVRARYLYFRMNDNFYPDPQTLGGGDRIGLGEIRFDVSPVPENVPEPSTAMLATFGLVLGWLWRACRAG
jgi:hypothetical protein